jgi:hypothetical protein
MARNSAPQREHVTGFMVSSLTDPDAEAAAYAAARAVAKSSQRSKPLQHRAVDSAVQGDRAASHLLGSMELRQRRARRVRLSGAAAKKRAWSAPQHFGKSGGATLSLVLIVVIEQHVGCLRLGRELSDLAGNVLEFVLSIVVVKTLGRRL